MNFSLPRGLDKPALEQLEKVVKRTHTLQNGDYMFRTGDEFKYIYALRSGSVKLHILDAEGNFQILGFISQEKYSVLMPSIKSNTSVTRRRWKRAVTAYSRLMHSRKYV